MTTKAAYLDACYADDDVDYFTPDERAEYERWLDSLDAADAMAPEVIADQNIDFPEADADLPF